MSFAREVVERAIYVAVYGAILAAIIKIFGIEQSIVLPVAIGFGVGWCACWFQKAWFGQPNGTARPGEAGLTRVLSQRYELDASIRQASKPTERRDQQ